MNQPSESAASPMNFWMPMVMELAQKYGLSARIEDPPARNPILHFTDSDPHGVLHQHFGSQKSIDAETLVRALDLQSTEIPWDPEQAAAREILRGGSTDYHAIVTNHCGDCSDDSRRKVYESMCAYSNELDPSNQRVQAFFWMMTDDDPWHPERTIV